MSIQPVGAGSSAYALSAQTSATQAAGAARQAVTAPEVGSKAQAVDAQQSASKTAPTMEQLTQAVKQIQDVFKQNANSLQFSFDQDADMTVVKVVDTESKKVIRQIPSQEVLDIAKALDKLQGLLVKQQA